MKLQTNEHFLRLTFIGAVLTILYAGILLPTGFLQSARLGSQDLYNRWESAWIQPPASLQDLLVITIDEESQRRLGKKWPWGRGLLAEFLRKLAESEPRAVVLDLVLSGSTEQDPSQDQALVQALHSGPPTLLASYLDQNGDPVFPYPPFTEAGGIISLINKPRDRDLTVRRLFTGIRMPFQTQPLYSDVILASALFQGISQDQIHLAADLSHLQMGNLKIPLQKPVGMLPIHYLASNAKMPTVSFWEVLAGRVPSEKIRGKLVLVGSAQEITHDIYPTPLGLMPGVMIGANGILTLLSGRFLQPLPLPWIFTVSFCFVLAILWLTYRLPLLPGLAVFLGLTAGGLAAGFGMVLLGGWQTESLSVVLLGTIAWLIGLLYKYALLAREALRLHQRAVTDPVSGAYTSRYFRLRLDSEILRRRPQAPPCGLLVVRMEKPSELLQKISLEQLREKTLEAGKVLRAIRFGTWLSQVEEDRMALLLPGLGSARAAEWSRQATERLRSLSSPVGFGLACTDQETFASSTEWIRLAQAAADRSWMIGKKNVELYDTRQDGITSPLTGGTTPSQSLSRDSALGLDYVASELEERNRALEKALEDLRKAHRELESHFLDVTKSLIIAMDTKDTYTAGHLERVSRYATRLAEILRLPKEEIEAIREAALLHDIGKLNLPDEVLHKVGPLTAEEVGFLRQHLELGSKILDPMKFFRPITAILYHHHERYDGKGYPHNLTGEFIPIGAQIIAIADSFDAMTTNRGYNKPKNIQEAVAELRKGAGTQFNPTYVETFAQLIEREGP